MYNSAFFSDRQEWNMPAKKAASKKQKRAGTGRKATASRKSTASKKTAGKKRKVSAKKSPARKASKKKTAARKKPTASKKSAKKSAKKAAKKSASKKSSRKKATKKVSRKSAKGAGKSAMRKKAPARPSKAASSKKPGKKSVKKAASRKKPTAVTARPAGKTGAAARRSNGAARAPSRQDLLSGPIHGIEPYAMRRGEEYMSPEQLEHFRSILTAWKRELMNEVDRTVHHMQDEAANFPDPNDRATQESEFGLELRTRDRERKLLRKIDAALARIDEGTYGYCDETGEEIGLKRLEARPVATLSLEAQERRELAERQFRDRDDRYR
jgi:DnaK suppressor protein